ncbi:MAG: putative Ig domain-containing protein [Piscinibacter sp.]
MTHILRCLRSFLISVLVPLTALPAWAALAQPSDNNLHIDRGVSYTNTVFLSTSGGTAPYSFSFAGALPSGISVSSSGLLTGVTCGSNGTYPLGTVTVTDAVGATASKTGLTLIVNAAPAGGCSLTVSSTMSSGSVGVAYSGSITATGGSVPYTYSVSSGGLPPGVTLSSSGALSGTPTTAGSYSFSVLAVDSGGATGTQTFSVTINSGVTVTVSPSSLSGGVAGVAYSQALSASGGTAPYSYAVSSGSLPAGMSLGAGGSLTGTPSAAGSSSFTVTATDANSATGSRSYTLSIGAALSTTQAVASRTLTAGVAATAFTPVTAAGGSTPYSFAVSPALPAGLSFNTSTGQVTGTPSAASASASYTVTVTDANSSTSSKTFSLTVGAALSTTQAVASTTLTAGAAATAFTPVTAAGGSTPYSFAVSPALPAGLSFNTATGQITGTPSTASASASYTVTVTDANSSTSSKTFSLTVGAALSTTQAVASTTLTAGATATAFTPVTAAGGSTPYSFAVSPALPAGLSFNTATGQITGTPSAASASASYTVTVTDANSSTSSKTFTLQINAAAVITVAPSSLSGGVAGVAYSQAFSASGGTAPYSYAVSSGSLPAGMSLGAGGSLTGTPSAAGSSSFTVTATDANSATGSRSYTLSIGAALSTTQAVASTTLTAGAAATAFTPVTAAGGSTPYSFAVSPALPAGLSFNTSTGQITGTPSAASASASYTVTVTDANSSTSSKTFTLQVNAAAVITVSPSSLSGGVAGVAYSQALSASGGTAPYSYAVSSGSLPAGMSLGAGGSLSGTPSAAGSSSFTVTATDANSATGSRSYTLSIGAALSSTQAVASTTLTAGTAATAFTPVTAAGGSTPHAFAISPALPAGLSFNTSTGQITGTPSAASASTSYTVTVTDGNGSSSSKTFTLLVNAAAVITVSPGSLNAGVAGVAYSRTLSASGGTAPYVFSVSAGSLPAGLAIGAGGSLSGTPTGAGSSSFTVTVTDANGASAARSYTLAIGPALSTTQAVATRSLTAGTAVTAFTPVTAAGGSAPYVFAVAPALPAGLSLAAGSGQISGTPTAGLATTSFTVTVTDANGSTSAKTFTMSVGAALATVQAVSTQTAVAGEALASFTPVTAAGGTLPHLFAISPALPAGLSFSTTNGTISGTPRATVSATTFTVTVTDAQGAVSTKTFRLEVRPGLSAQTQVDNTVAKIDSPVGAFTPVVASGGISPYAFSVEPALPAGLSMNAATGEVSGTPTQTTTMTDYAVTIADASGGRVKRRFRLATTAVAVLDVQPRTIDLGPAALPVRVTLVASGGTAPYGFTLASGTWPAGLAMDAQGHISGRARRAGTASVTVRVTDANGATVTAVLALSVGARPDPTTDATVNGLQVAEAEALKRFGSAQLRNMLERLDDERDCLPEMDVRARLGADWRKAATEAKPATPNAPVAPVAKDCAQGLAGWVAGTVQHGRINGSTTAGDTRFSTPGLTLGWDSAITPELRAGFAVGHASDRSRIGDAAGQLDASAESVAAYATWRTPLGLRVSAALGHANTTLSTSRAISGDTPSADGQRTVKQSFAALSGSARFDLGAWHLRPQLVLEHQDARLGAYAEGGDALLALAYDEARLRSNEIRGGMRLSFDWPLGAWALEPAVQIEWRRRSQGDLTQTLRYADDLAGTSYTLSTRDPAVEQGQIGLGLRARSADGWAAGVELRSSLGGGAARTSSFSASVQRSF